LIDALTGVGIGLAAGAGAGALSSFLGWNSSGDNFDARKFIGAEVTGILAGITLVFMNIAGFTTAVADTSGIAFVELLGTIVLGTLGVDFFRNKLGDIIGNQIPTLKTT
jgi:small neutral amino acid transporter SnatA (MarC family)